MAGSISFPNSKEPSIYAQDESLLFKCVTPDLFPLICRYLDSVPNFFRFASTCKHSYHLLSNEVRIWNFFLCKDFPDSAVNCKSENESRAFYKRIKTIEENMKAQRYRRKLLKKADRAVDSGSSLVVYDDKLISQTRYDQMIRIWDLKSEKALLTLNKISYSNVVAHQGQLIFGLSDGAIEICNLSGEPLRKFNVHQGAIDHILVSDDKIFSCSSNGTIKILNCKSGEEIQTIENNQKLSAITVHNDKIYFAEEKTKIINIIDLNNKENPKKSLQRKHDEEITQVIVYGDKLISCSVDDMIVWDLESEKIINTRERCRSVAIWNNKLIINGDYTTKLRDFESSQTIILTEHDNYLPTNIAVYNDSKVIIRFWNGSIEICDFETVS